MKCWHCDTELIWGGDHDITDEDEDYLIVTNLSCPNCNCDTYVYYPREEIDDNETEKEEKDWVIVYAPDADEWQVSDGSVGERSTSYDFKTRKEAEEWISKS